MALAASFSHAEEFYFYSESDPSYYAAEVSLALTPAFGTHPLLLQLQGAPVTTLSIETATKTKECVQDQVSDTVAPQHTPTVISFSITHLHV